MNDNRGRPRRGGGCTTLLGCLGCVAVGAFVVVRNATLWISGHPGAVWAVIGMMAVGGGIGAGMSAWADHRKSRRPPPGE